MATYRMTTAERRARARAIADARRQQQEYERQQRQAMLQQAQQKTEAPQESANFLERAFATVGDIAGNVISGVSKGLEGIYDFGAGIVGGIGGLFDEDFQEDVRKSIEYDWTAENIADPLNELTKHSYLNDNDVGRFIESVSQGVGQMLPSVAVSLIPGGQGVALATMGVSAAGSGTEEAFKDGADYWAGLGYGGVTGAIEAATEKLTGGLTKGVFGKGLLDGTGKVAATGAKRFVKGALEEGAEEMLAEVANPLAKTIYKGRDALKEYGNAEYWKGVGEAGLVGAATGAAYSGTVARALKQSGKYADVRDSLEQVKEIENQREKLNAYDMLNETTDRQLVQTIRANYSNVEKALKSATPKQRADIIKRNKLENAFSEDGSIKAEFAIEQGFEPQGTQTLATQNSEDNKPLASLDKRYISPSLYHKLAKINEELKAVSEDYREKYGEAFAEKYNKEAPDITVFDGEMSDTAAKNLSQTKKMVYQLNKQGDKRVNLVVTSHHEGINAFKKDDTIYISVDSFESGSYVKEIVHEYTHFEEGTTDYAKLAQFLTEDNAGYEKAKTTVQSKGYTGSINVYASEIVAHMAENLLGNEAFIEKIVSRDANLATKVFQKITNLKGVFARIGSSQVQAEHKRLVKAEKLWLNAAQKAGVDLSRKIANDDEEGVDSDNQTLYNENQPQFALNRVKYISYATIERNNSGAVDDVRSQLRNLYSGIVDGVADGIALEVGNKVYIVDSGKDAKRGIEFGFRRQITISDKARREQYIKNINKESAENDYGDRTIFERLGVNLGNNSGSAVGRELQKGLSTDTRQSKDNKAGVSQTDANRGVEVLKDNTSKFSLKDSAGNTLSQEQAEFFKDSKVRDENGNLLVVYHGSKANETVFKKEFISSWNMFGKGYYFTSSEKRAQRYAKQSLKKVYLNIQTPFYANERGCLEQLYDELNITQKKIDDYSEKNGVGGSDFFKLCYYLDDKGIDVSSIIQSIGYDGVYYKGYEDIEVIAYESNQIKLTTNKNPTESLDIRYSLKEIVDENGHSYGMGVKLDSVALEGLSEAERIKEVAKFAKSLAGQTFVAHDAQGKEVDIVIASDRRFKKSARKRVNANKDLIRKNNKNEVKQETLLLIDEVLDAAIYENSEPSKYSHDWLDNNGQNSWDYWRVYLEDKNNAIWEAKLNVANTTNGEKVLYDIFPIKKIGRAVKSAATLSTDSIRKEDEKVNSESQFSLKENTKYELSKGQVTKLKANYTREKAYARKEAEAIVNTVLSDHLDFGEEFGTIANKNKEEVVDILWQGLNGAGGSQGKVAFAVADYIIENAVMQNIYDDVDNDIHIETIEVLKPYLHSINLDNLKGEISHKGDNSIYAMWGKRKGETGIGVDQIAQELEEQGFVIKETADADILFEIHSAYRNAVSELKKKTKEVLKNSLSDEELRKLRNDIARDVMIGFDEKGSKSKLSKIIEEYRQKAYGWKSKYYDVKDKNKWERNVLYQVDKIKNIKWKKFLNATQYKNDVFKGSIESLSRIENRGSLNRKGTRAIIAGFREWYKQDNPILEYQDKENTGLFIQEIADILDGIAENVKPLTEEQEAIIEKLRTMSGRTDYEDLLKWYTKKNLGDEYDGKIKDLLKELSDPYVFSKQELVGLNKVLGYLTHFIETYNKILRNGEYVEAQPLAQSFIDLIDKNKQIRVGWQEKGQIITKYMELMGDPMTVARQMDRYEHGFNTDTMENLRQDAMKAQVAEMETRAKIDAFLEKNKNYIEKVSERKVKYLDNEIPLAEAMSLYLTLGRKQLIPGVVETGIQIGVGKDRINIDGVLQDGDEYLYQSKANEIRSELERQFTDVDRECVAIIKETLNNECRKMKADTDMALNGYTNIEEGDNYFPGRRADIAKSVDSETFFAEMDRVSNASFNKNIVKGAKQRLYIEPIFTVFDRHVRSVSLYANVAPTIHAYNVLYNIDVSGNKNKPVSIKTKMEKVWATHKTYIEKLVADIQLIPSTKGDGTALNINKIMGMARGAYARYQIGGNPKVILTQTSSLIAAVNILDIKSVFMGLGTKVSGEDVDKYCPLAKLRNYDNTAAMAQAVFDRNSMAKSKYKIINALRKFSDWLMQFVGKMDRFVIEKLYGACQVEVEKKHNLKIGTEENKQKAGELLTKVIFETQQNSLATERSAAMRSGNEFLKAATMFSADAMKGFGRFFDAIGEYSTLKARRKVATGQTEIEKIDARLNKVGKQVVKSTSVLVSSAVFMALIAQLFRWLYNKDEEDEDIMANMTVDAFGNMIGGLPLLRDLYNRIAQGYEIQGYSYSAINAIFDSVYAVPNAAITLVSGGDSRDMAKALKELINAAGMVTGVPTRNIYNVGYGLTKRISPATAYKIDDAFYSQGYRANLAKALENEDEAMIATIAGLMLNENIGGITDSSARKTIDDLVKKGFDVLPKSVSTQITYNDETVELSAGQQKRFKEVYNVANESLASLVKLSQYSKATDEVKAKAIRFIFDTYHNLAKQDVLGVELETKNVLFAEAIDIEKLAIIVATVNQMTADTKNGKVVSGSKKIKVQQYVNSLSLTAAQKYMIMGYLGYKNTNGETQVKSYINSLNLTASEKEKLLGYSGY